MAEIQTLQFFNIIKKIILVLTLMYAPVSVLGYYTYGDSLKESIVESIQTEWMQQIINLLIALHCILALTIVFNPLNQEIEEVFKLPHGNISFFFIKIYLSKTIKE